MANNWQYGIRRRAGDYLYNSSVQWNKLNNGNVFWGAVSEQGTILSFHIPDGVELTAHEYEIFVPLFISYSGMRVFLRVWDFPTINPVAWINNMGSGSPATSVNLNCYTQYKIDVCIGSDYENRNVIAHIADGGLVGLGWYIQPTELSLETTGGISQFFYGSDYGTMAQGIPYPLPGSYLPFYPQINHHGMIMVNNASASRLDFYIIARPSSTMAGISTTPVLIANGVKGGSYTSNPLFSIPYTTMDAYFQPEDVAPTAPGFESDVTAPGGGNNTPTYNNYPGEDIGHPSLPSVSILSSGVCGVYNPNAAAVTLLMDWLWSTSFIDAAKRMFTNNPMDCIIKFGAIPFTPTGSASTIQAAGLDSNISSIKVSEQFYTLDFGTVSIPEKWKSVMDYKYTKTSIYIPFVGIRNLDNEILMASSVELKYNVDVITGDAVATLTINKAGYNQSVYYTYECNMFVQFPLNAADRSAMVSSTMKAAAAAAAIPLAVALPGVGMAAASATVAASAGTLVSSAGSFNKTAIQQSGQFSASAGILAGFQAYLIIEQPVQSMPANFAHQVGFTSNITDTLSNLSGFTVVESVHLNIQASETELNEITTLLKSGVIF